MKIKFETKETETLYASTMEVGVDEEGDIYLDSTVNEKGSRSRVGIAMSRQDARWLSKALGLVVRFP